MKKVRLAIAYAAALAALLLLGGARPSQAQSQNRAGLVVQFGDGSVRSYCIAFTGGSISGMDLLLKSGLGVKAEQYGGMGGLVCKIGPEGCDYPSEVCACKSYGPEGVYWSYFHLREGVWKSSVQGAGSYQVRPGEVDGWAWSAGKPPAVRTFSQVCDAAQPQPQATGTPKPPPTATRQPAGPSNTVRAATPTPPRPRPTSAKPAPTRTLAKKASPTRTATAKKPPVIVPLATKPPSQATPTPPKKPATPTKPRTITPLTPTATRTLTRTPTLTSTIPMRTATSTRTLTPTPTYTRVTAQNSTPVAPLTADSPPRPPTSDLRPPSTDSPARTVSIAIGGAVLTGLLVWGGVTLAARRATPPKHGSSPRAG